VPNDPIERWEWEGGFVPTESDRRSPPPPDRRAERADTVSTASEFENDDVTQVRPASDRDL
jgi:hypothetical protein